MNSYKENNSLRFGNVKYNLKYRRILKMLLYVGSGFFLVAIILHSLLGDSNNGFTYEVFNNGAHKQYNSTYPLTLPVYSQRRASKTYQILAIADLDTNSKLKKDGHKYSSFLLKG